MIYFLLAPAQSEGIAFVFKRRMRLVKQQSSAFNLSVLRSDGFQSFANTNLTLSLQLFNPLSSEKFDVLYFDSANYDLEYQNYLRNVAYINKLYQSFESCEYPLELGASFELKRQNLTLFLTQPQNLTVVVQNTLFPCVNGSFYPSVELLKSVSLFIQPNQLIFYSYQLGLVVFVTFGAVLLAAVAIQLYKLNIAKAEVRQLMRLRKLRQIQNE